MKQMVKAGRCVSAQLVTHDVTFILHNVYLPSGTHSTQARIHYQQIIADEIAAWPHCAAMVVGDFNMSPNDCTLTGLLEPSGWRRPLHVSEEAVPQEYTFFSGGMATGIDEFFISPDMLQIHDAIVLTRIQGLQHCLLSGVCRVREDEEFLAVRHPPVLDYNPKRSFVSPIDWQQLEHDVEKAYRAIMASVRDPQWNNTQGLVDDAWAQFQAMLLRQMQACHDTHDQAKSSYIHEYGRPWKKTRPPQKHAHNERGGDLREARRAVHRLITLARGEGHEGLLAKIQKMRVPVCTVLDLTEDSFQAALSAPHLHVDHWVHKLSKASERLQRQQCAAWKRRLATRKCKPTRALFRWLKQGSRRGHYATKVGDVTHCGPAQYFDAHRQYWRELMLSTTKTPQTVTLQVTILCQQISKKKQHAPEHSFALTLRRSFVAIFWQKNLTKLQLAVLPFAVF